jgi:molecular chaperone GrpE
VTRRNRPNPADPVEGPTLHIDDDLLLEALAAVERRSTAPTAPPPDSDGLEIPVDVDEADMGGAGGEITIQALSDDLVVELEPDGDAAAPKPPSFMFEVPEDLLEGDAGNHADNARRPDDDRTDPVGFVPERKAAAQPPRPAEPKQAAPRSLLSDPKTLERVSRMRKRIKSLQRRVSELEESLDQERQGHHLARSRARISENSRVEAEEQRDNIDRFAHSLRTRVLAQEEELSRVQKRSSHELERARLYGADNTIREILPVLDNLGLALEHADTDPEKFVPGVRMVANHFLRSLERIGVNAIEASPGTPFDPAVHEAILTIPGSEHPEGTVAEEIRRGYTLHDRLLRASQVTVAGPPRKAKEPPVPPASDDAAPHAAASDEE